MGTAATSDGNNLVMALIVKRSRGLRRGWGAALWKTMTCCLSRVFSATSAARERSVSRIVASTALVISRSIQREYPAVCSRPGSLRHEHRQDPRHFQVRTEYLRRTAGPPSAQVHLAQRQVSLRAAYRRAAQSMKSSTNGHGSRHGRTSARQDVRPQTNKPIESRSQGESSGLWLTLCILVATCA